MKRAKNESIATCWHFSVNISTNNIKETKTISIWHQLGGQAFGPVISSTGQQHCKKRFQLVNLLTCRAFTAERWREKRTKSATIRFTAMSVFSSNKLLNDGELLPERLVKGKSKLGRRKRLLSTEFRTIWTFSQPLSASMRGPPATVGFFLLSLWLAYSC